MFFLQSAALIQLSQGTALEGIISTEIFYSQFIIIPCDFFLQQLGLNFIVLV